MDMDMDMDDPYDQPPSPSNPSGPALSERDRAIMESSSSSSQYQYFEPSLLNRLWAGPSHWRIQKTRSNREKTTSLASANTNSNYVSNINSSSSTTVAGNAEGLAGKTRKSRELIEFSPKVVVKPSQAFPAVKRTSDLCMNEHVFESKGMHCLPQDHHYSFDVSIELL